MYKKLNLAVKIGGGFIAVILLLMIVSLVSWNGVSGVADGFTRYRELARNAKLVGNFQTNLLMTRMSVKDYILKANDKYVEQYHVFRTKIDQALGEAQKEINDPERAKVIDELSSDILSYDKAFDEMVDLVKKRHRIFNEILNTLGPAMEVKLNDIMESSERNNDAQATYMAGVSLEKMALGRLYVLKFLNVNEPANENQAMDELDELLQSLSKLQGVLKDVQLVAEVRGVITQTKQYQKGFQSIVSAIYSRNKIISEKLDTSGPEMASNVETLKLSYQEDQDALGPIVQSESRNTITTVVVVSVLAILFGIFAALLITRSITGPVRRVVAFVDVLADGDFTAKLDVDQQDEIGRMSRALGTTVDQLGEMIRKIVNGVNTLASSSTELSAVSEQLAGNAQDTSARSNAVASAAEEMSTNMNSVSAAMEQSSSNVGMVATATEEMTTTVAEIAKNAAKAKNISEDAVEQSNRTSKKINDLGEAAKKIGKVTETITEISEQTNLLALNATIEAARAGEAGKGFAVVANEIKELAKQTAEATIDIKNQIGEMQGTTDSTIKDIENIRQVIEEINSVIYTIATAVEQQSAATSEIAENIAQASAGISEVNENVAQSSAASGDITKEIGAISNGSEEINQGSQNVKTSANDLSQLAEQLNMLVSRFKVA